MQALGSVGDILRGAGACRRADDKIAVDRRRHQDAFSLFAGALEDHMAHPLPLALVQQVVFSPAGTDGELLFTDELVDRIGMDACGVDEILCCEFSPGGGKQEAVLFPPDAGHTAVAVEPDAVFHRRLGHGKAVFPGVNNGGCRRPQCPQNLSGHIGLHGSDFFSTQELQPFHAVGLSPFQKRLQAL